MGTIATGKALDVEEYSRENPKNGNKWVETVIRLFDGRTVQLVRVASVDKFRGALPRENEAVALEVGVRAYVDKSGNPGYQLTAFGRNAEVEAALSTLAPEPVTA